MVLDDDRVEASGTAHQSFDDPDQVASNGAADAAVVHLVDFLVGLDDQVVIEPISPNSLTMTAYFSAMILAEDAVQKRRLAGARDSP